jgi:hypothetical protein
MRQSPRNFNPSTRTLFWVSGLLGIVLITLIIGSPGDWEGNYVVMVLVFLQGAMMVGGFTFFVLWSLRQALNRRRGPQEEGPSTRT